MSYGIGLDCGTTSIGIAVVALDVNNEPCRIIRLGSRVFTAAENPKDGSSLAAPRREKRSLRRRLRRHRHRIERIKNLIVSEGILSEKELNKLFDGQLSDIYEIRVKALDYAVDQFEFSRVLINLAQRRGFKSNRKKPAKDSDDGDLLKAVNCNQTLMSEKGYRTVGEMFLRDSKFSEFKRNKGGDYSLTVSRDMVEYEIKKIFESQRLFGNPFASKKTEEKYLDIVLSQRSFEEGPGGDSKYGGNQIEKMIGKCTLIPEEERAAKATYSFQIFTLWQKINNIRITLNGDSRILSDEERKLIFDLAHQKASLKYSDIRKKLGLTDSERFNMLNYSAGTEKAESASFNFLKAYHEIRKALNSVSKGRINNLSIDTLNEIGRIFTIYKTDDTITEALDMLKLDKYDYEALLTLNNFNKFGHVSVKACNMLIPFLERGMKYNEACEAAGLDFKAHDGDKSMFLPGYAPEFEDLTNPVVKRAVSQTIKVINAIIREQGESPAYINIELARELSKTLEERRKDEKSMEANRAANERILEKIRSEFGIQNANGYNIVKYKLWEEQDGICPYSLQPIRIERLFEPGYAEVDHIYPYSISFDDSFKNKVLVLAAENRNKGNRLPLQYLTGKRRDNYIVWVNANVKNYRKRQIMLKEKITKEDDGLKDRSLQDTQYLSRFLYNYISDHLEFEKSKTRKRKVYTVNGAITSYMRKRWGISKIREDGDLHHAADAAVIACVTSGMINRISAYSKYKEIQYADDTDGKPSLVIDPATGEVIDSFPYPWPNFRKELEIRLSNDPQSILKDIILPNYTAEEQEAVKPCFVSRMPTRKTKGAAHQDTVRSERINEDGQKINVSKVDLKKLKLKNGEIENYYNPGSDRLLYTALKNRLIEFGGNAEKAFAEPFYKPTSDGRQGPLVRKVKLCEKSSLSVPVNGGKGVAQNDTMIRIDVFHVENDGYYFVPIYVADTVRNKLPNKAVVKGKEYSKWKEMIDSDFLFSLYPNDIILVKSSKDIIMNKKYEKSTLPNEHIARNELLYYLGADIANAQITVQTHDGSYYKKSWGIKTLQSIEKYEVDPLGNVHKVGKEIRCGFKE